MVTVVLEAESELLSLHEDLALRGDMRELAKVEIDLAHWYRPRGNHAKAGLWAERLADHKPLCGSLASGLDSVALVGLQQKEVQGPVSGLVSLLTSER